ncbi:hypothetical protein TKK_0010430 [Trichogramma kaykai]
MHLVENVIGWISCVLILCVYTTESSRESPIFSNHFAVHIPSGLESASIVAEKYGFDNLGQIGALKDYYLFEHKKLRKRSIQISDHHHEALSKDQRVHWFQQQHEKKRTKRDNIGIDSVYAEYPSFFQRYNQKSNLRDIKYDRLNNRGILPQNGFTDPLFKEQWYLNGGAKDGFDMNLKPAWQKGYTGKGVVISILDDGIQSNHPDLAMNYDHEASTDINDNDDDPMPRDNGDNKHGTRCAGEVAAVAFNEFCGVGVAYNSSIGGVRMLDGPVNDAVEARALGLNPEHIDIYSASWGPEDDGKTVDGPGPLARRAFIYGVTNGRQGRGSIFVWASGNGGRHTDSCNCDGYTNSIFTLSISSATQGGFKPWYLEECSSTLASTYSSGTPGNDKSITTVDMDASLREDHLCTVEHTGTSASAPLAAGIAALALEANPTLTWRDMQYLVVLTSRYSPLDKETGWNINGIKRRVSHKFGYGLMDAGAIVDLAEKWTNVPVQRICKSQEVNEDRQIESTYGYTLSVTMNVSGCENTLNEVRFLEHVQCKLSLRFFPRGNLRISLTSPMGTTSTLLFERPRDVLNSNFDDWPFLSVHFWGEKAEGQWTLEIINAGTRHVNSPGILKKWQLIFYGTASNPIRLRTRYSLLVPESEYHSIYYPLEAEHIEEAASQIVPSIMTYSGPNNSSATEKQSNEVGRDLMESLLSSQNHCDNFRLNNKCVDRCPSRTFADSNNICRYCHESCDSCTESRPDSCLSCANEYKQVVDLGLCLAQCPDGYFEGSSGKKCIPCASNCATCINKPNYCLSCEHHLVLYKNKCYATCPIYTYQTTDHNCESCHISCETCKTSDENDCIKCRRGYFFLKGKCMKECPLGYYEDSDRRECISCPQNCAVCTAHACEKCNQDWIKDDSGICLPENFALCENFEFFAHNSCNKCHTTCKKCFGSSIDSCISCEKPLTLQSKRCIFTCQEGFYKAIKGYEYTCVPCLHTCALCDSKSNCTSCQKGLVLQSGECRSACSDGYYQDKDKCSKCYFSCKTCTGPKKNQCVTCPKGLFLIAGECQSRCPQNYFKTTYGCQKSSKMCRSSTDQCKVITNSRKVNVRELTSAESPSDLAKKEKSVLLVENDKISIP